MSVETTPQKQHRSNTKPLHYRPIVSSRYRLHRIQTATPVPAITTDPADPQIQAEAPQPHNTARANKQTPHRLLLPSSSPSPVHNVAVCPKMSKIHKHSVRVLHSNRLTITTLTITLTITLLSSLICSSVAPVHRHPSRAVPVSWSAVSVSSPLVPVAVSWHQPDPQPELAPQLGSTPVVPEQSLKAKTVFLRPKHHR